RTLRTRDSISPLLFRVGVQRGAVLLAHVALDDRLEFLGDAIALQGDSLLAVDVHRRHRHFVGAGQADADVGVLGFAGPVHHAAHYRDAHPFDTGIGLAPERHLRPPVALDLLGELLEIAAGGASA